MYISISPRVERVLSQITVGCLNYEASVKPTKAGALCGAESAAQVCGMSRAAFLAIAIWGGFSKLSDIQELKGFLMRDVVMKSNWFCTSTYLSDLSYRQKVDGLVLGAIAHLAHNEKTIKAAIYAERMGITRRGFNKTWQRRLPAIQDRLMFLLMIAADKINAAGANGCIKH